MTYSMNFRRAILRHDCGEHVMTDCPYGNEKCPVVTGPPLQHGMDCMYCSTPLPKDEVKRLPEAQRAWIKAWRKYNWPLPGGKRPRSNAAKA